ncbi:MAG: hypothetical protein WCV82_03350 [Candidatus Paceibacterota bacterium]
MKKDFDFLDELNKMAQPREMTNLEKALELAEQLKSKIDDMLLVQDSR